MIYLNGILKQHTGILKRNTKNDMLKGYAITTLSVEMFTNDLSTFGSCGPRI